MTPIVQALVVYVLYLAVVGGLWRWRRVDYRTLADSTETIRDGIVVPIGIAMLVPIVAATVLGWWGPILDQPRLGPSWALIAPIAVGLAALSGILGIDRRSPGVSKLPMLGLGVLFVGISEELLARGILVVGAREAGWSELAVFALSTGLFALLHGLNGFFGQSPRMTATQIVLAFVAGSAFYVTRMSTGSLVLCMVLHAAWDFGIFGEQATGAAPRPVQAVLTLVAYAAGLVAIWPVVS